MRLIECGKPLLLSPCRPRRSRTLKRAPSRSLHEPTNVKKPTEAEDKTPFVGALLIGLSGAADLNQNGRLTASELGTYLKQQVDAISLRLDGDGDTLS